MAEMNVSEAQAADAHAHAVGGKKHDYHLVDPSPWPIVGAIAAFVLAVGGVLWMRGGTPWIFAAGAAGVVVTMVGWWRDVVREAHTGYHTPVVQLHLRYGMLLFIVSEVMFFFAWFWAFFDAALFSNEAIQEARVQATGAVWPPKGIQTFDPWHLPLLNTLILLTSGTAVTWAHHALLEDDRRGLKQGLWLTVGLGVIFTACQAYEYAHAAFAFSGNIYGATFFMATGFHGAHVLIGTIFLFVCLFRTYLRHFSPTQHFGFEAAAWYWHFVDVVWLLLFACIYVWGAGVSAH